MKLLRENCVKESLSLWYSSSSCLLSSSLAGALALALLSSGSGSGNRNLVLVLVLLLLPLFQILLLLLELLQSRPVQCSLVFRLIHPIR